MTLTYSFFLSEKKNKKHFPEMAVYDHLLMEEKRYSQIPGLPHGVLLVVGPPQQSFQ